MIKTLLKTYLPPYLPTYLLNYATVLTVLTVVSVKTVVTVVTVKLNLQQIFKKTLILTKTKKLSQNLCLCQLLFVPDGSDSSDSKTHFKQN